MCRPCIENDDETKNYGRWLLPYPSGLFGNLPTFGKYQKGEVHSQFDVQIMFDVNTPQRLVQEGSNVHIFFSISSIYIEVQLF